ncbi:hypothetical protein [Wolbachia endosymbiont of Folsomia candida]|uniref:hypothetical protein n=1 Tax=Wolbachia endosymbiont of Folsomia candida TaxID=169402 RepID=UPI000B5FB7FC|nr:hypothetical protein [Wolbachia endosymbiont of Folsomia candida]APR98370.1 hypothetical protein ASM33_03710 [Wolbachia endosymbiont of Folsomia candida]
MIMLVNILFFLTPFLLPVLVYFEHQANFMIMNQDPSSEHKHYTLLQLRAHIVKLFINGFIWVAIGFFVFTEDGWRHFPFIIFMIILLGCMSWDYAKLENGTSSKIFNFFKQFIEAFGYLIVLNIVLGKGNNHFRPMIIVVMLFIVFIGCVPCCYAKLKNGKLRNIVAALTLITSSALSRGLAIFFILAIMNYFFGLGLYAFNI